MKDGELRKVVSERYDLAAKAARSGAKKSCCSPGCCGGSDASAPDPVTRDLYGGREKAQVPENAVSASLGCGNPTALADLRPGETVLDLGSGGGIDVLLSARRVGRTGKVYGLELSDEMLALARENRTQAGATNVEFLKGEIERIPLPDRSVDVVISNCVINLAADKDQVLREAFRVLRPGGRFAVSDVVVRGAVPAELRRKVELWLGCLGGALESSEYRRKLKRAGFIRIGLETTRVYQVEDLRDLLARAGIKGNPGRPRIGGKFTSAFIRATKPA